MLKRISIVTISLGLVLPVLPTSSAETAGPSLQWMLMYEGKSSSDLVNDPEFLVDARAYLPQVPMRVDGKSGKKTTPGKTVQDLLVLPDKLAVQDHTLVASGCMVHACGELVVLVWADLDPAHESLTVAFAIQQVERGPTGSSDVVMNLYVYPPAKSDSKALDPQTVSLLQDWLNSTYVGHIDKTMVAHSGKFVEVETPASFKQLPKHPL